ncbi:MAG: hypothetical protein ACK559_22605, partial [bacterium]
MASHRGTNQRSWMPCGASPPDRGSARIPPATLLPIAELSASNSASLNGCSGTGRARNTGPSAIVLRPDTTWCTLPYMSTSHWPPDCH